MAYRGKQIVIVGLGKTATALASLMKREGADVFVSEFGPADRVSEAIAVLDDLGIPYETGGHSESVFEAADIVIPSPGVSPAIPPITRAAARGAAVIGEMEAAWPFAACPILAVTGTNGKTTTTELLTCLLRAAGHRVVLAGNNACPLSQAVVDAEPADFMVLEVSSYQLDTTRTFRPRVGAVLNVTPDHLARHGTLENYAAAKARMFANQTAHDTAVLNADDAIVAAMAADTPARRLFFSLSTPQPGGIWLEDTAIRTDDGAVASLADLHIKGRHNAENALAALAMVSAVSADMEHAREGLRQFTGVEHRIEFVAERAGARFFNDSKATNVDSLAVALKSFEEPVVLIAGGQGKGAGYDMLRDLVRAHVKHLVTLGEDAPLLEKTFGGEVPCERAASMADAVQRAANAAAPGDAVLLSPACASFDMYRNFEERGRDFKACVAQLGEKAPL